MYRVRAYCAGISVFDEDVEENRLQEFLENKKHLLKQGELSIQFGMETAQAATELCVDVYDRATGQYRLDLSTAYKK